MTEPRKKLPIELESCAGDFSGLLEQIGHSEDVRFIQNLSSADRVKDLPSLKQFLAQYASESLYPLELPSICKAYSHATRYECRELIVLDQQLSKESRLQTFAAASSTVGRTHLLALRPLRENRFIQRYLAAMETGEANAWHTLVYGISLSIYSVPLRQGLLAYITLVFDGFAQAAASRLSLSAPDIRALVDNLLAEAPKQIDALLSPGENLFKAA